MLSFIEFYSQLKFLQRGLASLFLLFFFHAFSSAQSIKDMVEIKLQKIKEQNSCQAETIRDLENLFALIFSTLFTPSETVFEETEPNDEPIFANKINLHSLGRGKIQEKDKDYWKIYVPEAGELGLVLSSPQSGLRLYLYRYGTKREIKASEEPFSAIQKISLPLKRGLYFVQIASTSAQESSYQLRVTFLPASLLEE